MKIFFSILGAIVFVSYSWAENISPQAVNITASYRVIPDIIYLTADGTDLKLDIYTPKQRGPEKARKIPTVIFFHGGGWMGGNKDRSSLWLLPYLSKGYAAVNVDYRMGPTALAPAAVEDARCAVWWVKRNAEKYGFDPDCIILTGNSAGGHLSLIAGMLPAKSGLDARCPQKAGDHTDRAIFPELNVAAIINWAGVTDVNDLINGKNVKTYAVAWMGAQDKRDEIAQRISPISNIRKSLPPILTLHGDQDVIVPFSHAVRLHKALEKKAVTNQLHVIRGRGHFTDFSPQDMREAYSAIDDFLTKYIAHGQKPQP